MIDEWITIYYLNNFPPPLRRFFGGGFWSIFIASSTDAYITYM